MKAVILAAGVGSRLGRPYPKSLSKLPDGETILGRQIRILRKYGVNEIIIVVGFKKSLIMENFPQVYYKYNPIYYITNTAKSLLHGIEDVKEDVIWLNGDVIFDEEVLEKVIKTKGNLVAVNSVQCGEEEVKYRIDEGGYLSSISKTVKDAEGEAIGINKISKADIDKFKESLKECQDDDYFEKGIENIIQDNVKFKILDVSQYRCIEVDFQEDWDTAINLFSE
ncbi:UDP-N-acetylglucosamine pyrophosphorylase [Orenia metallireducens]|uniref:UDP-N-acetylglucosamine pyrophosphorylase n=1 Tax=Orenia metallireducens TaxID=1413210 RepID=A0A1C0AB59_9FIRM|nr:phosphocholine cytidylyltransferase family protein [Orenia metallireducens]OCL27615.1 UDP-N-acetylglucosamine pyrophosphorylase [Orenia metallireducens]